MTRHQPAHWIAGEAIEVVTIEPSRQTRCVLWYQGEWVTEGELTFMVRNQLQSGMMFEAEASGWRLNAVSVYDEWWDCIRHQAIE